MFRVDVSATSSKCLWHPLNQAKNKTEVAGIVSHFSVQFCFFQASMRVENIQGLSKEKGVWNQPVFLFSDQKSIIWCDASWVATSWNGALLNKTNILHSSKLLTYWILIYRYVRKFETIYCLFIRYTAISKSNSVIFIEKALLAPTSCPVFTWWCVCVMCQYIYSFENLCQYS